jgi:hypothetical protein
MLKRAGLTREANRKAAGGRPVCLAPRLPTPLPCRMDRSLPASESCTGPGGARCEGGVWEDWLHVQKQFPQKENPNKKLGKIRDSPKSLNIFNGQSLPRQTLHQFTHNIIGHKRILQTPPQKVNFAIQIISGFFPYLRIIV